MPLVERNRSRAADADASPGETANEAMKAETASDFKRAANLYRLAAKLYEKHGMIRSMSRTYCLNKMDHCEKLARTSTKDELQPVGAEDPERAIALKKHEEGITKSQDKTRATDLNEFVPYKDHVIVKLPSGRFYVKPPGAAVKTGFNSEGDAKKWIDGETKGNDMKKHNTDVMPVGDELPVPIKTSNLVPLAAGQNNEERYAPRPVGDADSEEICAVCGHMYGEHSKTDNCPGKTQGTGFRDTKFKPSGKKASDRKKATDAKAVMPIQSSGSEPADHMTRANEYEVTGDRARALDSYRAAAGGFRRANDRINETKARDGINACQAKFAAQYDHPGHGRVKVCDSAAAALRTAVERTRAGEAVFISGTTVRPDRARATDVEITYHYAEKPKPKKPLLSVADPAERKKMAAEPYRTKDAAESEFTKLKAQHGDKYSDDVLRQAAKSGREPWSINLKGKDKELQPV